MGLFVHHHERFLSAIHPRKDESYYSFGFYIIKDTPGVLFSFISSIDYRREKITEQISQRDKIMTQVSSALERSNSTDLSSTLEKVSIIQMLQNQVQAEQARSRQLEVDYRALREKYDTKVAEVQEKAAEMAKLELRLFMAGVQTPQARNGTPGAFPWSSPVANRGRILCPPSRDIEYSV
jgi:hypothetical protein